MTQHRVSRVSCWDAAVAVAWARLDDELEAQPAQPTQSIPLLVLGQFDLFTRQVQCVAGTGVSPSISFVEWLGDLGKRTVGRNFVHERTSPDRLRQPLRGFFIASARPTTRQAHQSSRTPVHETLPTVTATTTVIPEPATLTLLALGSLTLLRGRRGA